jgi:RNA polymerase sigma-70 factor (ECF subfamily)
MLTGELKDEELVALLARCACGESAALSALYRATAPHLLGCLMRILRRRALAEEALQDVFVQVWQRAAQFEQQRGRVCAWLVSIARYRAIDIMRRERMVQINPLELAAAVDATLSVSDDETTQLHAGNTAALRTCLGRLNPEQRQSIELAFINGRTHPEVAVAMNRPVGSVKSWIRRGLAALKECLESCNTPATN